MAEERIPTWSYSALSTFEKCPYRSYLQKIKKIPEPQHPAAKRGTDIHDQAEHYVRGDMKRQRELSTTKPDVSLVMKSLMLSKLCSMLYQRSFVTQN